MTPKSVTLEIRGGQIVLWAEVPGAVNGRTVIESVKNITGKSIPGLKKVGAQYAKRWGITFHDKIN